MKPVLENTDYTVQKTGDNEITIQTVILQVQGASHKSGHFLNDHSAKTT